MTFYIIYRGKVQENNPFLDIFRTNYLPPCFVNWKSKLKEMCSMKRVGEQKEIEKSGLDEVQSGDTEKTGS